MVLPTKILLELPCDDDQFIVIKKMAEESKAVVLEITHSGRHGVGFKAEEGWIFGRPPMYHLHQAVQWANRWERITWDWSYSPRLKFNNGDTEVIHANDIYMALRDVGYSLKSLKLSNMTIDGTTTDMKNLATAIQDRVMESIEFTAVNGVDQRAKDLLPTLIPSLRARSLELKWCHWADSHLESLELYWLRQLEIWSIEPVHLEPVLKWLHFRMYNLKMLKIGYLVSSGETTYEQGLYAEFGNRLAELMLENKTLESLSFPIMYISHSLPLLKALRSTNRTLKDVNFRLVGSPWNHDRKPTTEELEELKETLLSVVQTENTVIERISFSNYKGAPADFWPLVVGEVEYYLKLNREGMRSELLKGYGENDHKWWDTLVRNKDNCDISYSYLLLKNNFRAFFGGKPGNENRLVALFTKRPHDNDKDRDNDNSSSESPDKKHQRVQAVDS
jgi:hypothetical protein